MSFAVKTVPVPLVKIMNIISYTKLCRYDAALIAFFSYITGAELAGGSDRFDFLSALLVTLVSTNFIYSINSWADRDIDKINKSYRPIPSGIISPKHALYYSLFLLTASVIYPFFIYNSFFTLFLFLLLPVLGILYSLKPVRIRNYPIPAVLTISTGLITPLLLGFFMNSNEKGLIPFFTALYVYCLFVIPLKQIEEKKEDRKENNKNLYIQLGHRLLYISITCLALNLWVSYHLISNTKLFLFIFIHHISTILTIFVFKAFNLKMYKLYTTIIRLVIFESIILYGLLKTVTFNI